MIDPKEAIKFYKTQLKRCKINLDGAKDRRDYKAIANIQHKINIYEYTVEVLYSQLQDTYKRGELSDNRQGGQSPV